MNRRAAGPIVAILACAALTGCGSSTEFDEGTIPASSVDIRQAPGSGSDYVGALGDATISLCDVAGREGRVAGTVQHHEAEPQSYRIYVTIHTDERPRAIKQIDVENVAPHVRASWQSRLVNGEKGALCSLHVERYTA